LCCLILPIHISIDSLKEFFYFGNDLLLDFFRGYRNINLLEVAFIIRIETIVVPVAKSFLVLLKKGD